MRDTLELDGQPMEVDVVVVWCFEKGKIKEAWDIPVLHTARILEG